MLNATAAKSGTKLELARDDDEDDADGAGDADSVDGADGVDGVDSVASRHDCEGRAEGNALGRRCGMGGRERLVARAAAARQLPRPAIRREGGDVGAVEGEEVT